MINMRIKFSKLNNAKYISHLDLNRVFSRAVAVSDLDVWFTEGFNTHIYLNFALALPLGVESVCEMVDIRFNSEPDAEKVKQALNGALPRDIAVTDVYPAERKFKEIAFSEYEIELFSCENVRDKLESFLTQTQIVADKQTKSGVKSTDLRPLIAKSELSGDSPLSLRVVLAAGTEKNLNPIFLLGAAQDFCGKEFDLYRVKRVGVTDKNSCEFI